MYVLYLSKSIFRRNSIWMFFFLTSTTLHLKNVQKSSFHSCEMEHYEWAQNLTITQQNKGRILRFHTIRACTKKHENTHIDRGKTWLKIWHVKDASKKGLRACGFSPRKIEKKKLQKMSNVTPQKHSITEC